MGLVGQQLSEHSRDLVAVLRDVLGDARRVVISPDYSEATPTSTPRFATKVPRAVRPLTSQRGPLQPRAAQGGPGNLSNGVELLTRIWSARLPI